LTDSQNSTKSGRIAEILGNYDPRKSIEALKGERIKELLSKGVGLTGSVNNLLIKKGIIRGKKIHVGTDNVVKAVEATPAPEAPVEAAPVAEEAPAEPVAEAPVEEIASAETPSESTPA
jgi:ribosomal protein S16